MWACIIISCVAIPVYNNLDYFVYLSIAGEEHWHYLFCVLSYSISMGVLVNTFISRLLENAALGHMVFVLVQLWTDFLSKWCNMALVEEVYKWQTDRPILCALIHSWFGWFTSNRKADMTKLPDMYLEEYCIQSCSREREREQNETKPFISQMYRNVTDFNKFWQ